MKKTLLYSLLTVFLFTSSQMIDSRLNVNKTEAVDSSQPIDSLPPCFSSYKIFPETAIVWEASWVAYYNNYSSEKGNFDRSPQLYFDKNSLDTLRKEVEGEDYPGILLWYVLLDPNDSIPSLAMQNTTSCVIDDGVIILMCENDSSEVVEITQDSLTDYIKNWEEASINKLGAHVPIKAYNYSWDSLEALMAIDSTTSGIYFSYGLRTLEPNESGFDTPSDPSRTGSVIYCNILSDSEAGSNTISTLEDFAMPCPIYCGTVTN